ncbi:glycosyltransferase family 2 protein [Dactylosporangium sp. CA-152071]|uniref:glycosyltransferase family 2 protein n=1 Tax=Dactylosporangium sp. CA-152071 TaxID=3239933 RepID=UPI003D922D46
MTPKATIVIPCRHEEENVGPLIARLSAVLHDASFELLFVDDSDDERTVDAIAAAAARLERDDLRVRVFHRTGGQRTGGLAGAVVDGFRRARAPKALVMDADLQHPPELVPAILAALDDHDLVMASRYREGGSSGGLDGPLRRLVSTGSTILARVAFPFALRGVTDPMTGFFAVRLDKMDTEKLRSRGFKILLEILARFPRLRRTELPLRFAERVAGTSKGDLRQGLLYLRQLPWLRLVTWFAAPAVRWGALLGTAAAGTAALAVSPLSGAAVLALLVTAVALYNTVVGALEVRWRLYGWRTPEAVEQMRWPAAVPDEAKERFTIIVPALNEEFVIAGTLRHLLQQDHDDYEILVSLCEGDDATLAEVRRVQALDDPHGRVRTVVRAYPRSNKPRQLNAALAVATGTVIGVVDAEDDVAPQLLTRVNTLLGRTDADVVQGGVQLMTLGTRARDWFKVHNVMEYFFWFTSRMFYQVRTGFVPLGGNTVFIRRRLLEQAGGWPDNLTEDCALGVLLCTRYGARVVAAYEPELATREEVPQTIGDRRAGSLFWQRVRWNQGFLSILLEGRWATLPTLRQRVLAGYILATPFLQAFSALLLPLSIATILWLKVPVGVAMLMYAPFVPIIITLATQLVGLREFAHAYRQKVLWRHYLFLLVGAPVYQWVLMGAAFWAVWQHVDGNTTWHKTAHGGHHRPLSLSSVEGAVA